MKMSLSQSMKDAPGATGFRSRVPTASGAPTFSMGGAPSGLDTIFSNDALPAAHQSLSRGPGTELGGGAVGGGADPEAGVSEAWDAMVADCRVRCAAKRAGRERGAPLLEGVLYQKSRFYSRVRMGKRIWQRRWFVLDDNTEAPLRYHRVDANDSPNREKWVVINLYKVVDIDRVSNLELHLVTNQRKHKLRCEGADGASIQEWFDFLVCKIDECRKLPEPIGGGPNDGGGDHDDEHEPWWRAPDGGVVPKLLWALVLPLKALIHLTIMDVANPKVRAAATRHPPVAHRLSPLPRPSTPHIKWTNYYMLALLLSALWLSACAYVMTVCLDRFGCATGISSTVMGLTVGAVGTSFPNLYASILTAVAGQAGMSICQAFGSNTFNICICLGLVWLLETVVGQCEFGSYTTMTQSVWGWCAGCYLPVGLAPLCPFDTAVGADLIAGSLTGAVFVVLICMGVFVAALLIGRGHLRIWAAAVFFTIYLAYIVYEIVAAYTTFKICIGGSFCI